MNDKRCPSCDEVKLFSEFGLSKSRKDGHSVYCKQCVRIKSAKNREKLKRDPDKYQEHLSRQAESARVRRANNPDKYSYSVIRTAQEHRLYRLFNRYGLTEESIGRILGEQNWGCAVCRTDIKDEFVVDHDHRCCPGRKTCGCCVRGFLCQRCNKRLGFIENDEEWLKSALDYLKEKG